MPKFLARIEAVDGPQTISVEARSLEEALTNVEIDYGKLHVISVRAIEETHSATQLNRMVQDVQDGKSPGRASIGQILFRLG